MLGSLIMLDYSPCAYLHLVDLSIIWCVDPAKTADFDGDTSERLSNGLDPNSGMNAHPYLRQPLPELLRG